MPVQELMRWDKRQKRWFKKHGRPSPYAVSPRQLGCEPTREASRQAANEWWQNKLKEIDAVPAAPQRVDDPDFAEVIDRLNRMRDWFAADGQPDEAERIAGEIKELRRREKHGEPLGRSEYRITNDLRQIWQDRFDSVNRKKARTNPDRTIKAQARAILDHKEAQFIGGERSAGRWGAIKAHLEYFCNWQDIGEQSVDVLTAAKLREFYTQLLLNKDISGIYKRDIFSSVKNLIKHCAELDMIPLPKNIGNKDLVFRKTKKKVLTFELDEIEALLSKAEERTKLYLLLMMNCGFQQSDISDLHPDEVDWKAGRITRKRSKTESHEDVPEVCWLLWPETFALLKKLRSQDANRVLISENGLPLKQEGIDEGKVGILTKRKLVNNDLIRSAYMRLIRDQLKLPKEKWKPLKRLRKTSSTLLEKHLDYGRYAQFFLGQAPEGVANTHYVRPSQTNFDKSVTWLGKQYGLLPSKKRAKKR